LDTGVAAVIWLAIVLGFAVGNGAMFATQPAFFSELFGANVRYSGVSLGYQVSAVIAGGLAPFIATALLAWAGSYWPVALYIMVVSLISFVSVFLATETFHGGLAEELGRKSGAEVSRAGRVT
jgi:MHS family shikimate/dehydroshikimate transporter-like MFS transporter